jgi:hypothetical protein
VTTVWGTELVLNSDFIFEMLETTVNINDKNRSVVKIKRTEGGDLNVVEKLPAILKALAGTQK